MAEAQVEKLARRALEHAALSGVYEPHRFLYDTGTLDSAVMARLGRASREIIGRDNHIRWRMRDRDRAKILRSLVLRQSVLGRRLRKRAPLSTDLFAQILALCLPDKARLSERKVDTLIAACAERTNLPRSLLLREAIAALTFAAPLLADEKRDIARSLERDLRAETIRHAIAAREDHILPHGLCGREEERAAVFDFIFADPPEGELTPAQPPILRLQGPQTARSYRSLLITGSPGMGKSAFLTDFARRLAERPEKPLVIAFDFDQMTLAHGGRVAWMAELTRQIALEAPALGPALGKMRAEQSMVTSATPTRNESVAFEDMLRQTRAILGQAPELAGRPIVLLLDTLEEITAQNNPTAFEQSLPDTVFWHLDTWAERMNTLLDARVAALFTGRNAPPVEDDVLPELFHAHLKLPKLTPAAAADLMARLMPELGEADYAAVAAAVYGHPLLLIIISKQLKLLEDPERAAEIADLKNIKLDGDDALQTLYTRFLQRMRLPDLPDGLVDDHIRKLAHPGLLLPEVTVELLRDVIAPSVGVDLTPPGHAEAAFQALAEQIWLVRRTSGGTAVTHDREVRRIMLPLMIGQADDETDAVLTNGITYFEARNMLAEAGYLRALRGETDWLFSSPEGVVEDVFALVGAQDLNLLALPVSAAIRRIVRPDDSLSDAEIRALPEALQAGAIFDQQSEAVKTTGRTTSATQEQAPQRSAPPGAQKQPLFDVIRDEKLHLQIANAFISGDWEEARHTGWEAILNSDITDVNSPIRTGVPFHESWIWRLTLITLALGPPDFLDKDTLFTSRSLVALLDGEMIRSPDSIIFDLDMLAKTVAPDDAHLVSDVDALGMYRYNDHLVNLRMMREAAQSPLFRASYRARRFHVDVAMASGSHGFLSEDMQDVLDSITITAKDKNAEYQLSVQLAQAARDMQARAPGTLEDVIQPYARASLTDGGLVTARVNTLDTPQFRNFVIAQLPEIHDAVAGAMLDVGLPDVLGTIVEHASAPHLPPDTDLASLIMNMGGSRSSSTEIFQGFNATVRLLDLFGMLPDIVRALAEQSDTPRLRHLEALCDAIDANWRALSE